MASIILRNIDEKFCQCCVCFEQYEDPRQLDCLHRYCKKCLEQLIGRSNEKINCPLCQAEFKIPENGAEGFKKDFYINEILEFIQVHNSLEEDQVRKCVGCSDQDKSTAYCFKCSDFLCEKCYVYHITSKVLLEHRPHILTLKDLDEQNMSMEKLSSLREAPRCQTHPANLSQLCCETCSNLPICVTCTYGEHRNHDIFDVISFAKTEREKLKQQLEELNNCKEEFFLKTEQVGKVKQEMISDADSKLQDVKTNYQQETEKFKQEIKKIQDEYLHNESEISKTLEENKSTREKEMEEKISQIREEYKKLEIKDKLEGEAKLKDLQKKQMSEESKVRSKQELIDKKFEDFCKLLENEKNEKVKKAEKILDQIQSKIKRCENITQTGSGVLSSDNDWTIAQNVDSIFSAAQSLTQDMKLFSTENLPGHLVIEARLSFKRQVGNVRITEKVEKVFGIEDIHSKGWRVSGLTCANDGSIVLTGPTVGFKYHITVVSYLGKLIKQRIIRCSHGSVSVPESFCDALQGSRVVICCDPHWIGLYDLGDDTLHGRQMSEIVDWPEGQEMRSLSVAEGDSIIVGCGIGNAHNIYILNQQLEHSRTLQLRNIKLLTDFFVSNGRLLACDWMGMKINIVNMNNCENYGMISSPVHQCQKPISVCADKYGITYVLWSNVVPGRGGTYVIAQYDKELKLLRTKPIYTSVRCFAVGQISSEDKLLIASYANGKVYQYGLRPEEKAELD